MLVLLCSAIASEVSLRVLEFNDSCDINASKLIINALNQFEKVELNCSELSSNQYETFPLPWLNELKTGTVTITPAATVSMFIAITDSVMCHARH